MSLVLLNTNVFVILDVTWKYQKKIHVWGQKFTGLDIIMSHLRLSQDTNHIIGITAYEYVLVAEPIQIYFKAGSNHPYVSSCNVVLQ